MFSNKLKYGLLLCTMAAVVACSKKEIPQGTRISVLPVENSIEKEISSKSEISLPAAKTNKSWRQNGGDSNHILGNLTGNYPLQEVMRIDFGASAGSRDMMISEPIIAENMIFTLDADAKISAFNLNDGSLVWKAKALSHKDKKSKSSLKATGLAANDLSIFAATGLGEVVAHDIKTGSEIWRYDAGTPIRIAPAVSSNHVFVQTIDNRLIAINTKTGEEVWNYEVMQEDTTLLGGASPTYDSDQDIVVAAFSSGDLQALKASTGSPLWTSVLVSNRYAAAQSSIAAIKANPVIDGERLYAIGNSKTLAAIDTITGERLWDKPISGSYQPIISGDYIFVLSNNNFLTAINKNNGNTIWSKKLDLSGEGKENTGLFALRPLLINNYILVAVSDGKIFKIDAASGEISDTFELREELSVSPIAVDGSVIFTTSNAKLIVYK